MDNSIFMVTDESYCIWGHDVSALNDEFLNGIDTGYFDYILSIHSEAEDEKRASIGLRAALHHSIETLFILVGAYVQAPNCAYAWAAKCKNHELREIVERVDRSDKTLYTALRLDYLS